MKHILNMLAAIVFGLLVSVEYVGATPKQEQPAPVGALSPMLSSICVGNVNMKAEECIKGVVQMMKFARVIGHSEVSCSVITSFNFITQTRCEEFDKDPDVQEFYMWIGKK